MLNKIREMMQEMFNKQRHAVHVQVTYIRDGEVINHQSTILDRDVLRALAKIKKPKDRKKLYEGIGETMHNTIKDLINEAYSTDEEDDE